MDYQSGGYQSGGGRTCYNCVFSTHDYLTHDKPSLLANDTTSSFGFHLTKATCVRNNDWDRMLT